MEKITRERYTTGVVRELVNNFAYCEKHNVKRLRTCTAYTYDIYEGGEIRYKVLQSYNTIVAYFDYDSGVFCDVLRVVYGYTATSAQHIAKFKKDLGNNIVRDIRFL